MTAPPVIEVQNLQKWFPLRGGLLDSLMGRTPPRFLHAVDGVSFSINAGEILGVVGESGSGKTTVGMTTLRLYEPTGGSVRFLGQDIAQSSGPDLLRFRRSAQIVFQNPYESLNPRFTIFDTIVEPLRIHGMGDSAEQQRLVIQALERAELHPPQTFMWRYPHELSGGQRQRVAIARAIVLEPRFLVADEPVSMLDVSIRAGVLNLLQRFAQNMQTAILYISHDLATVRYICRRTMTMYAGQVVEAGETETLVKRPYHPYTQLLIKAIPRTQVGAKRERVLLEGEVPDLVQPPVGCRFQARCPMAMPVCLTQPPPLREVEPGHQVACHLYETPAEVIHEARLSSR